MTSPVSPADVTGASHAIRRIVRSTPVLPVMGSEFGLSDGITVHLKLELLQHSGSFKARGASHFIATQPIADAGVVAASGGNHGAAVAWAAQRFGHAANIFVPTISAPAKVERLRSYGAIVHQVGQVYAESLAASLEWQAQTGATSIHAYDDPVVLAGAGTCAREFDFQIQDVWDRELDVMILACGGGGLAGGAASWLEDRFSVVTVETEGTRAHAAAKEAGQPTDVEISGLAADALGATRLGTLPWQALSAVNAEPVTVTDEELASAKRQLWHQFRIVTEPSAAAPLAAITSGRWTPDETTRHVGLVICGANTTLDGE